MIRFIDLGEQIGGIDDTHFCRHFAWYDTVYDEFVGHDQQFVWETWKEFEEFLSFYKTKIPRYSEKLKRFRSLFPDDWEQRKRRDDITGEAEE
jgi:hypothetical protein